jgi:hypothetical protein
MSDADRNDPSGDLPDSDLEGSHRPPTEEAPPSTGRKTEPLDLNSFFRPSSDLSVQEPARTTTTIDLRSFMRVPDEAEHTSAARTTAPVDVEHSYHPPAHAASESANGAYADSHHQHSIPAEAAPEPEPVHAAESSEPQVPEEIEPAAAESAEPHAAETEEAVPVLAQEAAPIGAAEPESPSLSNVEAEPAFAPVDLPEPPPQLTPQEQIARMRSSPILRYAAIGGLLGVVFAAALIGFTWVVGGPAAPYDLGNASFDAAGLQGHLFLKFDNKKLEYRLSVQPVNPDQKVAFAYAVANPPRPISLGFQLKDAQGFVLCTTDVVLKYDPARTASLAASAPPARPGSDKAAAIPDEQGINMARMISEEAQRVQGKDVFQNQAGADGRIESLSAQGAIPCSDDAYQKITGWSFSTNFPTVNEQSQMLKDKDLPEEQTGANSAPGSPARRSVRRRQISPPTHAALVFAVEGDDELVGYDPSGIFETETGASFYLDRQTPQASLSSWQNFPVRIHYRCDQTSVCTLTQAGTGAVLHARLKRVT